MTDYSSDFSGGDYESESMSDSDSNNAMDDEMVAGMRNEHTDLASAKTHRNKRKLTTATEVAAVSDVNDTNDSKKINAQRSALAMTRRRKKGGATISQVKRLQMNKNLKSVKGRKKKITDYAVKPMKGKKRKIKQFSMKAKKNSINERMRNTKITDYAVKLSKALTVQNSPKGKKRGSKIKTLRRNLCAMKRFKK